MSYPDQVPQPKRDHSAGYLMVLGGVLFLAGCIVFVLAETPSGGFWAGILVSVSLGSMACAGLEMPKK